MEIKPRRRKIGETCRKNEIRNVTIYKILVGKPAVKRPLGRPTCRLGILLKWMLNTYGMSVWTGYKRFRVDSSGGLLWTQQ
jgi:hypothetical protein